MRLHSLTEINELFSWNFAASDWVTVLFKRFMNDLFISRYNYVLKTLIYTVTTANIVYTEGVPRLPPMFGTPQIFEP